MTHSPRNERVLIFEEEEFILKNDYEIRGDVTAIFLKRRDGSVLETIIDTVDLSIAQEFPNSWYAHWDTNTQAFYVYGNMPKINGKRLTARLHRWIMDAPNGFDIDHVNHETLFNRRSNLRIVSRAENMQNRKGARRDNKSGIRGVTWNKTGKKWEAKIQIKGRQYYLGLFDYKHEAERIVAEYRAKHMPYSQEAMMKDCIYGG